MSLTLAPVVNTTTVTLQVPKETHELVEAIVAVVSAAKTALADGFQPGLDIPLILAQALQPLLVGLQGADQLGVELKAEPAGFAAAWAVGGGKIAALFAG